MIDGAPICWVLTEGIAGTENQCLGLADALGLDPVVKRATPRWPWRRLASRLLHPSLDRVTNTSDPLAPPWPRLLIASGNGVLGLALALRRRAGCFTVFVQKPRVAPSAFDLVVAPRHDEIAGPNVIVTRAALHRVTPERLAAAAAAFRPLLDTLPRPLTAVLIGGTTRRHRFGPAEADALGRRLARMIADRGGALAVTASRRTGPAAFDALDAALGETPRAVWRGDGENPYFGYLACADAIVVTGDSISMTSEACATGKPVFVAALPGRGSARFDLFFESLMADGLVRPLTGAPEPWSPEPLIEMPPVAAEVAARFNAWQAT